MSMNFISPITILNNVDISVTQTSAGIHIMNSDNVGIQVVWTGTPTGTFSVKVSNTATLNQDGSVSGGTWSSYTVASPPAPAGSSGNGFINLNQLSAAFVQLIYTAVSGAGNCTATLTAKSV